MQFQSNQNNFIDKIILQFTWKNKYVKMCEKFLKKVYNHRELAPLNINQIIKIK